MVSSVQCEMGSWGQGQEAVSLVCLPAAILALRCCKDPDSGLSPVVLAVLPVVTPLATMCQARAADGSAWSAPHVQPPTPLGLAGRI